MKLPVLFGGNKDNPEKPDEALMNKALLLLHALEREYKEPVWTKEVIEAYEHLATQRESFENFLNSQGFGIDENLGLNGFEREIFYGTKNTEGEINPEELIKRAAALKSFLLQQIHLLTSMIRPQKKQTKQQIQTLVELTTKPHLYMTSPGSRVSYMDSQDRTKKFKRMVSYIQLDLKQLLLGNNTTSSSSRGITRYTPPKHAVIVSTQHAEFLDRQKSLVEFMILAYIFKSKDVLTDVLLGYTQDPSFFDKQRPFVTHKGIDG